MLDQILRWIEAGDSAINGMGPVVATLLAMLGASGITQLLKFPMAAIITNERWLDWSIKVFAVSATVVALSLLNPTMPAALVIVLAAAQPYGYTLAMRLIRKYWPWLEATRVVGSAVPSEQAVAALQQRREARDAGG